MLEQDICGCARNVVRQHFIPITKAGKRGQGMSKDGMYYKVSQEYSELKNKKRKLMRERDIINTKIEIIELFEHF